MTTALKLCVLESSPRKNLAMWHKLYKTRGLGECKIVEALKRDARNSFNASRITFHDGLPARYNSVIECACPNQACGSSSRLTTKKRASNRCCATTRNFSGRIIPARFNLSWSSTARYEE